MPKRESKNYQLYAGIAVLLCGILMGVIRLDGWMRLGEQLHFGATVVFICLGAIMIAMSQRRKTHD